ncbi:MAG: hypothetical protein D6705_00020 [Deltaproteobacteria bacterium]|nr:MAG: hypothetical protein D6705_00020 [Deltaproteobacteria bacterium]
MDVPQQPEPARRGPRILRAAVVGAGVGVALVLASTVLKPLFILGALGAAAYLGYRASRGPTKALSASSSKALAAPEPDDFERKMAELDALSRRLDREIDELSRS